MNILICTVGAKTAFDGALDSSFTAENLKRVEALSKLLRQIADKKLDVDLIVLPGGYFAAANKSFASPHIKSLPGLQNLPKVLRGSGIAICYGIDIAKKTRKTSKKKVDRIYSYSCAWLPEFGFIPQPWQSWGQRSSNHSGTSKNADDKRTIMVGNKLAALLMCGEIFNRHIEAETRKQSVEVVLDMVHTSYLFRRDKTLMRWSSAKPIRAALMSSHAIKLDARKCWAIAGKYYSTSLSKVFVSGIIRIEGWVVNIH